MITLMRPWTCLLLLIILSDVLGMEYKEPEKEKMFKALNGSWIFAEYTINVLDGKESSDPQYHQINATYNNALRGMTVSEVDVTTGEVTKHLFDLYEIGAGILSTKLKAVFPGRTEPISLRVSFPNEETAVVVKM